MNKKIVLISLLGLFAFTALLSPINAMDEGAGADRIPSRGGTMMACSVVKPILITDAHSGHQYSRDGQFITNLTSGEQYVDPMCLEWEATENYIRQLRDNINWSSESRLVNLSESRLVKLRNYLQTTHSQLNADASLTYVALYFAKVASATLLESLYATRFEEDIHYFTLQLFLPVAHYDTSEKMDFFGTRRAQFMRTIDESPGPVKNVKRRMMDKILAQMP